MIGVLYLSVFVFSALPRELEANELNYLLSTELAASEPENLSSHLKKAMVVLSNHFHAAHIPTRT